ncbi:MAG TPA: hypothetical protein VG755_35280, partial [Nannocystaceae bacterium]|nr:hypothetical protein [Nannocystaceae bacterium]
ERALADDRWVLDPLVGARAIDLGGRMIAAAVLALPLFVATIVVLGDAPWHALVSALAAVAWTATVAVELVTHAEARRTLRRPQVQAIVLRIAIAIAAALVLGVLGLVVHALVAAALATRRWQLADRTRRRFARLPGEIEAVVS